MIFRPASKYDSDFYIKLLEEIVEPAEYFNKLKGIQSLLNKKFPGLRIVKPPTVHPKTAYIEGVLLPIKLIKDYHLESDEYVQFGLEIFVCIPENFQKNGIVVYDSLKVINWDAIHIEYRHCNPLDYNDVRAICTHHYSDINKDNCIIGVLRSAFYLYQEYKKLERTGKFNLVCHEHSYKGVTKNGK